MPLQAADFFGNLPVSPLDPTGTDSRTISDDQHREIIAALKGQGPNWTGAITATHADLNTVSGLAAAGTKPMPGVGGLTVLYFYNINTPPPGWTLLAPDANIRQLVIGDAASGGTIGGTDDPLTVSYPVSISLASASVSVAGSVGATALTVAQMPSHRHDLRGSNSGGSGTAVANGGCDSIRGDTQNGTFRDQTGGGRQIIENTGSGATHDHDSGTLSGTLSDTSGTGTATGTPRYASGILGTLDA